MSTAAPVARPSKITIPAKAIPHVKLVYQLMRDSGTTYNEMEFRSGILKQTFKAWRAATAYPSLFALEAALGVFGWSLVPVPPLSSLKPGTLEKLEDVGMDFVSDQEALAAVMATVCKIPVQTVGQPVAQVMATITPRPRRSKEPNPFQTILFEDAA